MSAEYLIRVGAVAQAYFNMRPGVRVIVTSDIAGGVYQMVSVSPRDLFDPNILYRKQYINIPIERFSLPGLSTTVSMGYSAVKNVLVIQKQRGRKHEKPI